MLSIYYDKNESLRSQRIALAVFVSGFAWLCYFGHNSYRYVPSNNSGVWVLPQLGSTTLVDEYAYLPNGKTPAFFVSNLFKAGATVSVRTTDDVPMVCTVKVDGIQLDKRDTKRLEGSLLGLAVTHDPDSYLNGQIIGKFSSVASAVLASHTSDEISDRGTFRIQYQLGTPMGDMLADNVLRWKDGIVSSNCSLVKFQS